jgi:hypothetical protein
MACSACVGRRHGWGGWCWPFALWPTRARSFRYHDRWLPAFPARGSRLRGLFFVIKPAAARVWSPCVDA